MFVNMHHVLSLQIIFVHVDPSNEEAGKPVVEFFGVTGDKATVIC